jgi:hypothetical protein
MKLTVQPVGTVAVEAGVVVVVVAVVVVVVAEVPTA